MLCIAHRVNTSAELSRVPPEYGVELDLRDRGNDIILSHDPFQGGEKFEDYLKHYRHRLMILNVKSERIEPKILEVLKSRRITDYFFLDSSFPMIHLLTGQGEKRVAVRFSEFEGLDTVLAMKGRLDWVWVDCFTKLPINRDNYALLKAAGFKLCLVSPELQGRPQDIPSYRDHLKTEGIVFDAVCTKLKNIPLWENTGGGRP